MSISLAKTKAKTLTKTASQPAFSKEILKDEELRISPDDRIVGRHFYGNLYDLDRRKMNDMAYLKGMVTEAIKIANMTLVEVKSWSFGGKKGGVSVIALITESHVALHIWNEYNYATLDIYTCGEQSNPEKAFDHIVDSLNAKNHKKFYADRSM